VFVENMESDPIADEHSLEVALRSSRLSMPCRCVIGVVVSVDALVLAVLEANQLNTSACRKIHEFRTELAFGNENPKAKENFILLRNK